MVKVTEVSKKFTKHRYKKIYLLYLQGFGYDRIADKCKVSRETVIRAVKWGKRSVNIIPQTDKLLQLMKYDNIELRMKLREEIEELDHSNRRKALRELRELDRHILCLHGILNDKGGSKQDTPQTEDDIEDAWDFVKEEIERENGNNNNKSGE